MCCRHDVQDTFTCAVEPEWFVHWHIFEHPAVNHREQCVYTMTYYEQACMAKSDQTCTVCRKRERWMKAVAQGAGSMVSESTIEEA
jgi:hypothetical protein